MDTSPQAASNKVTVECTDPSGLLSAVQPLIAERLPLRNLHWKSPSRPVRSIESLHIDLVPAQHATDEQKRSSDAAPAAPAHRRHQIPGLRQTPYLKIYLLRCDDNETYKSTSRKLLREWIKTHASTPQSSGAASSQENHDAFEWLILHVVQDGEAAEKTGSSMWPGLGSTSVLEKIKADFNGSSKSSVDRVAQIRLPKPGATQRPSELDDQLDDLVEKMKNSILTSFDLRVSQYEEDIREKDSQRSLPGWNFCTFFILKEGLARGFENVGLFEDALVGYDELAVGLDTAVREHVFGTSDKHGGTFLPFSKDWKEKAEKALGAISQGSANAGDDGHDSDDSNDSNEDENGDATVTAAVDPDDFPLDANKKPYREKILANDISIFDFRTYLFSRQLTLLLRAARAPSLMADENEAGQKSGQKNKEDLARLAEACRRATEFIGSAARTLRYDLECGLADVNNDAKTVVIDNLVSSWTYAAASQVLSQTATPALPLPESSLSKARDSKGASVEAASTAEARQDLPRRSSSLFSGPGGRSPRPTQEAFPSDVHTRPSLATRKSANAVPQKTGSEELASGRGELYLLARRVLEDIGRRRGWAQRWKDLNLLFDDSQAGEGDMEEVSLEDDKDQASKPSKSTPRVVSHLDGIDLPVLNAAFGSRKRYLLLYEELTDQIFRHYAAANRTNSAEMARVDIALLRYRQADYETAASYFNQVASFYGNKQWPILEGSMLELYARCLKELKRNDEYVRVLLKLLAKYAANREANMTGRQKKLVASSLSMEPSFVASYVEELFRASSALQKECSTSLTDFFGDLEVNPAIRHYEDKDGFKLQMSLRFFLQKEIKINSVKIRLVNANRSLGNEVWLESSEGFVIKPSLTKLLIGSSITLQGKYFVDRIEMRCNNLAFVQGHGTLPTFPPGFRDTEETEEEKRPYIYCYPPASGLEARITTPHYINLEELRTMEMEIESGWNNIKKGVIRVRPATAGLRLRVAEATVVDGKINVTANQDAGNIEFTEFGPGSFARFRIPYTIEENHTTLSARLEIVYETELGRFSYISTSTIVSTLPVNVNVQDLFKNDILFSRFTVSPAMLIPLRVLNCHIPSSEFYDVQSSMTEPVALDVFPKQPASILFKIKQREDSGRSAQATRSSSKRSLRLTVEFTCLDEECLTVVRRKFRADIEQSKFRDLSRLLTPHIVEAFRTQLSTSDMEVIGLVREVEMLPYEKVQWDTVLSSLSGSLHDEVKAWLMEWHKSNPVLQLPDPNPSILSKRIVIPVDVPEVPVVHTAELKLANLEDQSAYAQQHAAVGQVIAAELHLRHTRRWSHSPPDGSQESGGNSNLEFSYEIHANPEQWLVGGRKRGNYTAKEGETQKFAIMLLPQKAGHLLLPGVEIKTFVASSSSPSSSSQQHQSGAGGGAAYPAAVQRKQIPCEVDYRSHGETVLVLPDLKKTTVSLPATGGSGTAAGGGSWLVDSERRRTVTSSSTT